MRAHVDQLGCLRNGAHRRFDHIIRGTGESDNGPVGRLAWVDVEELDSIDSLDLVSDLPDYSEISPFAEVGNAFDQGLQRFSAPL